MYFKFSDFGLLRVPPSLYIGRHIIMSNIRLNLSTMELNFGQSKSGCLYSLDTHPCIMENGQKILLVWINNVFYHIMCHPIEFALLEWIKSYTVQIPGLSVMTLDYLLLSLSSFSFLLFFLFQ